MKRTTCLEGGDVRYRRTDIELNHGCMIRETTAKAAMCRRRLSAVSTYGHCAQSRVHDSRKHRESTAKATRSNAKATRKQREHRESSASTAKAPQTFANAPRTVAPLIAVTGWSFLLPPAIMPTYSTTIAYKHRRFKRAL